MRELVCIVCPKGCRLHVDENDDYRVTGFGCQRGVEYGKNEVMHPTRVVTSTVAIKGAELPRCPVKTNVAISKKLIFDAMKTLDDVILEAPVKTGQVVVPDVCGTGADFVVTRDMDKK